jgi:hypothetical protein
MVRTVLVPPDSELIDVLREAAETGETVELVTGVGRFEVQVTPIQPDDRPLRPRNPEQILSGLQRSAGILAGLIDVESFLEEMKASREQDSIGRPA